VFIIDGNPTVVPSAAYEGKNAALVRIDVALFALVPT
jgi:hypothetical protein